MKTKKQIYEEFDALFLIVDESWDEVKKMRRNKEDNSEKFHKCLSFAIMNQRMFGIEKVTKYTKKDKEAARQIYLEKILNPPPPKTIIHNGHRYVLESSLNKNSISSKFNEDAQIIRNHSLLGAVKDLVNKHNL